LAQTRFLGVTDSDTTLYNGTTAVAPADQFDPWVCSQRMGAFAEAWVIGVLPRHGQPSVPSLAPLS